MSHLLCGEIKEFRFVNHLEKEKDTIIKSRGRAERSPGGVGAREGAKRSQRGTAGPTSRKGGSLALDSCSTNILFFCFEVLLCEAVAVRPSLVRW